MNQFEERGRRVKVSALLVLLIDEGRTPEEVSRWHADRWTRFAARAGCRPPSLLTMLGVVEQLERRAHGRQVA